MNFPVSVNYCKMSVKPFILTSKLAGDWEQCYGLKISHFPWIFVQTYMGRQCRPRSNCFIPASEYVTSKLAGDWEQCYGLKISHFPWIFVQTYMGRQCRPRSNCFIPASEYVWNINISSSQREFHLWSRLGFCKNLPVPRGHVNATLSWFCMLHG